MYLLDTQIVLELRRAKTRRTDPGLTSWAAGVAPQSLFISALTLLELETAVERLERKDKAGSAALRTWLDERVMTAFAGRILPVDAAVARQRARLPYADSRNGLLAATAIEHGLTLVTRNVAAFKAGRVKTFNPWGYAPKPPTEPLEEDADWRQVAKNGPQWLKNLFIRS
jgi:predicted nucleic acid-binding protein